MFFATAEFQSSFCVFATIECSKKKIGLMSKYVSSFDMDCSSDIRYTSLCKQRCVLIDTHLWALASKCFRSKLWNKQKCKQKLHEKLQRFTSV